MSSEPGPMLLERCKYGNDETGKAELLDSLARKGVLTSKTRSAMASIDRTLFIPKKHASMAYEDHPIDIGEGQTISAPHMYAMMTKAASIDEKRPYNILEIGTGSGYQSAILAEILRSHGSGHVHTIERVPSLAKRSRSLLNRLGYGDVVDVHLGDGSTGYKKAAPFDRILVTAGAPQIPEALFNQLAEGGIMIIPAGKKDQSLYKVTRKKGKAYIQNLGGVSFVPLIGRQGWNQA